MAFNTEEFMLQNESAKKVYAMVKDQPIFDYHCHLSPQEIFEDKPFENIVSLWLGGDHYKWRLMRANGVPERAITGDAPAIEKFEAWAKTLSKAFGSPLYHWSHLEMKQIFGIQDYMTSKNWEDLYQQMNHFIVEHELSPRKLIQQVGVQFIGTTDHPLDDLKWHQAIAADESFSTQVSPTFRPDEAFVGHVRFPAFVAELGEVTGKPVKSYSDFLAAMEDRIIYFAENGCRSSDISFAKISFKEAELAQVEQIFQATLAGESPSFEEVEIFQSYLFADLCGLYKKHDLVTQVHFGALRNNNKLYANRLGADSGFDSMGDQVALAENLNHFLNHLVEKGQLPKMIFYNLNPSYNVVTANTLANFQANEEGIVGQVQFGAAWWFGDTERGMIDQMESLADQGLLAGFVGMLTDSRSFLSYQRHDYFRRILANLVGTWVEEGKIPDDEELIQEFVAGIAYKNAENYFRGENA